jgi:CHAD domain-containing protein
MAYRLEHDESVAAGLERVLREEIESAASQLAENKKPGRDKAIHDSRKNIKKVRALLRLISGKLGDTHGRENARLRDIARRLSEFRDAFAIIETFDTLKKKYKDTMRPASLRSMRAGLTKRRKQSANEEDVVLVLNEAADALGKASKRVKTWPLPDEGFESIAQGLEKTYRDGRKALARARKEPAKDNYHELRKRVKDQWYHIRLLECLWTEMMVAYEKSLKEVETWLGDDHNLAVLAETIAAEPAFYGAAKDTALTLGLISSYQEELRTQALALAERIYEEKPREFVRRIAGLWDTWRRDPTTPAAA